MAALNSERPVTLDELARKALRQLFDSIVAHEAGVMTGDIEAVHDMRVASRRLRVALSNFAVCFLPDERRSFRQQLAELADVLGNVRDLDVMIESLEIRHKGCTVAQQKYLEDLIRRLNQRRKRRRKQLNEFLSSPRYAEFKLQAARLMQSVTEPSENSSSNSNG